jgi:hypothetical protein
MEKGNQIVALSLAELSNQLGALKIFLRREYLVNSTKTLKRKLTSLSGGGIVDPHVECGFNYKYFPIDSVLRFNLVEDLVLWRQGYSSHLVNKRLCIIIGIIRLSIIS